MKQGRLNQILHLLVENKFSTARSLASFFSVSTRTIFRDIEILKSIGVPLYMDKGNGGGIRIARDYKIDEDLLNEEEKKLLVKSISNNSINSKDKNNEMVSKLTNLLNNNVSNWIEIDFDSQSTLDKEKNLFDTLKKAILNKNVIEFHYYGMYSTDEMREIEPLRLVYRNSAWYLYGFYRARMNYRFFKVRSMSNLHVLEEKFDRQVNGSVIPPKSLYAEYQTRHIKLRVSSNLGYRAFDEFTGCKMLKDGSVEVNTDVLEGEWLIDTLLSYGTDLKVIEPEELKQEMKEKIEEMLKIYSRKTRKIEQ
jgi:predicted DNA-binding transcriptional regulator YafY